MSTLLESLDKMDKAALAAMLMARAEAKAPTDPQRAKCLQAARQILDSLRSEEPEAKAHRP